MDERAGVAPTERRRCWQPIAEQDDASSTPGARAHATIRVSALSGTTTEATIADAPARWGLPPAPPGTLPPPPPPTPAVPAEGCVARARSCDAQCNGSSAWADCLDRCDRALGACLGR